MKTSVVIAIVVIILLVAGAAWYAYSNPTISAELGLRHSTPMNGMNMGTTTPYDRGGMQGGFVTGAIEVLNASGFTVTLANGDTKDINLFATTTLQNYASASSTPTTITLDQLSVGEQVQVVGTPESDGSIDARFVRTGTLPTPGTGTRRAGRSPYGQAQGQSAQ